MTAMKRLLILLVLAAFLPSCFDIPQLDIDLDSVSLADEGGSERIRVTSNVDWSATASAASAFSSGDGFSFTDSSSSARRTKGRHRQTVR